MTKTNRFGVAVALVVAVLLSPNLAYAKSAPLAEGLAPLAATKAEKPNKKKEKKFKCKDKSARILYKAGFRGWSLQMAWAITYRESKHQNLDESSPWYTGALGWFQVQSSAHSGKSWWSRDAMLDKYQQARIVYKYMTNKGTNWVAWGLNSDGSLNTSNYGGWSSWQHEAWIMKPFRTGIALYPCK